MKTFSIMEAQHNLARVLREVEAGHEVGITRRNQLVARLLPPAGQSEVELPDFVGRARKVWGGAWEGGSSDDLLDESRGER
jgi:prevent-host-death family protein